MDIYRYILTLIPPPARRIVGWLWLWFLAPGFSNIQLSSLDTRELQKLKRLMFVFCFATRECTIVIYEVEASSSKY